ncbi:hypothetical protein P4S55_24355 [Shewanella sp. PP-Sp27a-2]
MLLLQPPLLPLLLSSQRSMLPVPLSRHPLMLRHQFQLMFLWLALPLF